MVKARNTLFAGLTYSVVGEGIYLLTQLGILSALAHMRGAEAVGQFGLALAVATPVFVLSSFNLRAAQAVDIGVRFSFAEYAGVRLTTTLVAIPVCLIIGYLLSADSTTFAIVLIITFTKSVESVSDLAYGAFQQAGRMDRFARSLVLRGSVTLGLFATLLFWGAATPVAFCAQLLVWTVVGMLIDYPAASRLAAGRIVAPRIHAAVIAKVLAKVAPLGLSRFLVALEKSIPRFIIDGLLGITALGYFTTVAFFLQSGATLAHSVVHVLMSHASVLKAANDQVALRRLVVSLCTLFFAVSVVGLVIVHHIGPFVLSTLFGAEYAAYSDLLLLIMATVGLRVVSTVPRALMYADERFMGLLSVKLITLVALVVLCFPLVAWWGLLGAGYAILAREMIASSIYFGTLVTWYRSVGKYRYAGS